MQFLARWADYFSQGMGAGLVVTLQTMAVADDVSRPLKRPSVGISAANASLAPRQAAACPCDDDDLPFDAGHCSLLIP